MIPEQLVLACSVEQDCYVTVYFNDDGGIGLAIETADGWIDSRHTDEQAVELYKGLQQFLLSKGLI